MSTFSLKGLKVYKNSFQKGDYKTLTKLLAFKASILASIVILPPTTHYVHEYMHNHDESSISSYGIHEASLEVEDNQQLVMAQNVDNNSSTNDDIITYVNHEKKIDSSSDDTYILTEEDKKIASNVVFLVSYEKDHNNKTVYHSIGTGTIIKDSGNHDNVYNRILTSNNVKDNEMSKNILVMDNTGTVIAIAQTEFKPDSVRDQDDVLNWTKSNYSVLDVVEVSKDYTSVSGLKIASTVPGNVLEANINTPHNITYNSSGSPLIDKKGDIIGIISRGYDSPDVLYTENNPVIGAKLNLNNSDRNNISSLSDNVFTPFSKEILSNLNNAGNNIKIDTSLQYKSEDSRLVSIANFTPTFYEKINVSVASVNSHIVNDIKNNFTMKKIANEEGYNYSFGNNM